MLFSGDDAFKPLRNLSGGETARLILGGLLLCSSEFSDPRRTEQPPRPRSGIGSRLGAGRFQRNRDLLQPRPRPDLPRREKDHLPRRNWHTFFHGPYEDYPLAKRS